MSTRCLSHASYLVGDETTGLAAVVEPRRDVGEYVADAEAAGLRIAYVIETHFHADFLSPARRMAERLTLIVRAATAGDAGTELMGYVDAEANHEDDRRRQRRLDDAFEILARAMDGPPRP